MYSLKINSMNTLENRETKEDEVLFKKCYIAATLFNVLKTRDLIILCNNLRFSISKFNLKSYISIESLKDEIYLHIPERKLFREISKLMMVYYKDKIGLEEIKNLFIQIINYPERELAKLYLHMNPDKQTSKLVWKFIENQSHINFSKNDIMILLFSRMFILPKELAITTINNDIKVKKMCWPAF